MTDSGLVDSSDLSGRGVAKAEDAQGTPTQSHTSPSILVYEDKLEKGIRFRFHATLCVARFMGMLSGSRSGKLALKNVTRMYHTRPSLLLLLLHPVKHENSAV